MVTKKFVNHLLSIKAEH